MIHVLFAILLAGEPVRFDPAPQFTPRQLRHTAAATRAGLARWAATEHGRLIINALAAKEYDIMVLEDDADRSAGNARAGGGGRIWFVPLAVSADGARLSGVEGPSRSGSDCK